MKNLVLDETKTMIVIEELKEIVHIISAMEKEEIDEKKRLISYGLDSILLLTLAKQIHAKYKVEIPLDVFFTTLNTLQLIADYIAENGIVEAEQQEETYEEVMDVIDALPEELNNSTNEVTYHSVGKLDMDMMVQVFNNQYDVMTKQNEILKVIASTTKAQNNGQKTKGLQKEVSSAIAPTKSDDYYKPYKKLDFNKEDEVDELQLKYIKNIEQRINIFTKNSKDRTQQYRNIYASNRNSAGFRPLYKEMLYQIIAEEGQGSKIIDIDGNTMIDLTMGFGVLMFGHSPEFVRKALRNELEKGMPVGPMGRLTGRVAQNISELAGVDRVFFCNSGTEANMFAVRVARAVTGKKKIVCFTGAFHGTYDGFLGMPNYLDDSNHTTTSLVPGITDSAVQDVVMLDFNSESSLQYIEQHCDTIAAVITEPIQSRRPDIQPKDFLLKLRQVTQDNNVALIFDEIITGFRIASGGAQEYFGVEADIVTYGKVIGGGMPIGVLAGKKKYLDSIDGGMWNFGDNSVPPNEDKRTFVAGTFCHHPMAMAATNAVLEYIKENKHTIYQTLNLKTTEFVNELNQFFEREHVDIRINQFGSLFRFTVNLEKEIFYYGLLEKGIYIWEGRNCFLSTEHSKEDIEYVIEAVKKTVYEMKEANFFNQ